MSKARGIANYESMSSDFNILNFIISNTVKGLVNTCFPVTVTKVDVDNLKVNLQPLIAQTDGEGNKVDMPEFFAIPFMRYQAGSAAVIINPQVGDIGFMVCFQQDASSLEPDSTKTILPQTMTAYPLYSGVYVGGFLQKAPSAYIEIDNDNITISCDKSINIACETANVDAKDSVTIKAQKANINATQINLGENASKTLVNEAITDALNSHVHNVTSLGSPTSAPTIPFVSSAYSNPNIKESV